jgi:hypothetical protein
MRSVVEKLPHGIVAEPGLEVVRVGSAMIPVISLTEYAAVPGSVSGVAVRSDEP